MFNLWGHRKLLAGGGDRIPSGISPSDGWEQLVTLTGCIYLKIKLNIFETKILDMTHWETVLPYFTAPKAASISASADGVQLCSFNTNIHLYTIKNI